jgi:hypothetical protein
LRARNPIDRELDLVLACDAGLRRCRRMQVPEYRSGERGMQAPRLDDAVDPRAPLEFRGQNVIALGQQRLVRRVTPRLLNPEFRRVLLS